MAVFPITLPIEETADRDIGTGPYDDSGLTPEQIQYIIGDCESFMRALLTLCAMTIAQTGTTGTAPTGPLVKPRSSSCARPSACLPSYMPSASSPSAHPYHSSLALSLQTFAPSMITNSACSAGTPLRRAAFLLWAYSPSSSLVSLEFAPLLKLARRPGSFDSRPGTILLAGHDLRAVRLTLPAT